MKNKVINSKQAINTGLIFSSLVLLTSGFQNCSDVGFTKIEQNTTLSCPDGEALNSDAVCVRPTTVTTTKTIQAPTNKVDILLVIDNSGSMKDDNIALSQRLAGFVTFLNSEDLDWQACYTTTDVSSNGDQGRSRNWIGLTGQNVLNNNDGTPTELNKIFSDSIGQFVGGGSGAEQGVGAISLALEQSDNVGCFREDAALTTIVISDEDESSCGGRTNVPDEPSMVRSSSTYIDGCQDLNDSNRPSKLVDQVRNRFVNNNKIFLAHSLVIKGNDKQCFHEQDAQARAYYGLVYEELTGLTGGIKGNICSDDYTNELRDMADNITNSLTAMVLDCVPYLNQVTMTYRYTDNVARPNPRVTVSGNKVLFATAVPAGTVVTATYSCLQP